MAFENPMTFPGESAEYRAARDELLRAEVELRRHIERIAEQRRALPPGGNLKEDYSFEAAADGAPVRLSELFGGHDTLLIYSFMYREGAKPCPMCSSFLDSFDGAVPQLSTRISTAVIARAGAETLRDWATIRGWSNLRLLSSAGCDYNVDYHGEGPDGSQWPMVNVFQRTDAGIHHTWASEMLQQPSEPGQNSRHVDMIWPLWHTLDLTPGGRGDWYPSLDAAEAAE